MSRTLRPGTPAQTPRTSTQPILQERKRVRLPIKPRSIFALAVIGGLAWYNWPQEAGIVPPNVIGTPASNTAVARGVQFFDSQLAVTNGTRAPLYAKLSAAAQDAGIAETYNRFETGMSRLYERLGRITPGNYTMAAQPENVRINYIIEAGQFTNQFASRLAEANPTVLARHPEAKSFIDRWQRDGITAIYAAQGRTIADSASTRSVYDANAQVRGLAPLLYTGDAPSQQYSVLRAVAQEYTNLTRDPVPAGAADSLGSRLRSPVTAQTVVRHACDIASDWHKLAKYMRESNTARYNEAVGIVSRGRGVDAARIMTDTNTLIERVAYTNTGAISGPVCPH